MQDRDETRHDGGAAPPSRSPANPFGAPPTGDGGPASHQPGSPFPATRPPTSPFDAQRPPTSPFGTPWPGADPFGVPREAPPGRGPTELPPPPGPPDGGGRRRVLLIVLAVAAVLAVAGGVLVATGVLGGGVVPPSGPDRTPVTLAVVGTSSSCAVTTGQDAAGTVFTYEGAKAVDGDPSTAWRCPGTGVGQTLVLDLGAPRTVTAVGLVPGFAKVDPYDGTDRWVQSPRIRTVSWRFDDGSSVVQSFDAGLGPTSRQLQSLPVAPRSTRSLAVTVLDVDPGRPVNGKAPASLGGFSEAGVTGY